MTSDNNLLAEHYQKSDRAMLGINGGLIVYALLLANWYNTWAEAITFSLITAISLVSIYRAAPGSVVSRMAMAASFMVMSALHIHQTHGMIEFHFGIFVLLAVLLYYRDWIPLITAAAVIATHHFFFYYLQSQGSNIWVLQTTDSGWWVILLHAAYVIVETAILIWLSLSLKKDAIQSVELASLTERIIGDGVIDLTLRSSGSTKLLGEFDGYTEKVEYLAQSVKEASSNLNAEGQTLAHITEGMTNAARTQQVETDRIATATEEMTAAIQEVSNNADVAASSANEVNVNAEQATSVSKKTQNSVEQLAQQIDKAVITIQQLNEQSRDIGSVLDVIRGIADQTNLLALNAAIEAARAGEQGRGFAVVADEVRTLAQRTQQSTEEIDQMINALQEGSASAVLDIESSRSHVDYCVENTKNSLELMESVGQSIQQVNQMNTMIATAASQQTTVINEIASNVSNILNASNKAAEDASQAAESGGTLLGISKLLTEISQQFKVK